MAVITRPLTVDDLLRLGSDARVEVVRGEVVEMTPVGGLHNWVAKRIAWTLDAYVEEHKSGLVFTDSLLYVLSAEEEEVRLARVPDASYIRTADIPADWDFERPYPGAPTLAVEVMSPDDQFEDVVEKVHDYFAAGTAEVWVVLPRQKAIYRYRQGQSVVETYRAGESMDASDLFPGLALALTDVFTLPDLGR
ncbi:MAG: Uma2 family endonuclease [Chloroflexota bacterium]|jgi:Uma2 family endonuclease